MKNIFDGITAVGEEEQFDLLMKGTHYRIDRIVSSGHSSPQGFWSGGCRMDSASAGKSDTGSGREIYRNESGRLYVFTQKL